MKKLVVKDLLAIFQSLYPNPGTELIFKNNYQLLIAVVLSAQCTDKKVNEVTPFLFKSYPNFATLSIAKINHVEKIIRPINYYKTKAKHLISLSKKIVKDFNSEIPKAQTELLSLPGVGRKTANVIQSELKFAPALPVDTHVFRVSKRLGLAKASKHNLVEDELKQLFPSELWQNLHHWLILHGRRVCKATRPLCQNCELAPFCPSVDKPKN